jgi:hypothetical protein
MLMRNIWQEEPAVTRAIEEDVDGEENRGVNLLWWAIACLAGGIFWLAIFAAFA